MAIHPDFPKSPHNILIPDVRWFPADEALRESSYDKLLPPLVHVLRKKVKEWRDSGYDGASDTSKALLNWWFEKEHILPQADGTTARSSIISRSVKRWRRLFISTMWFA